MEPTAIQLFRFDDGRYFWEVCFADDGLDQSGYARDYTEARRCIEATIENAAIVECLPPEGAVE